MHHLPLHTQIDIWLIIIATAACFLACGVGIIRSRCADSLPPVPQFPGSRFPCFFSYFYTAFFILTFSMASVQGAMMPPGQQLSTMDFLLSMLVQIALYVPFLVVYFTLPKRSVPHTGIIRKLVWVLVGLFTVSISAPILDICGFSGWLMKATGCPEHQEVVRTLMDGSWADKALMAFMAVIAAPITEECCFRGFVYNILKHWTTPLLSVVLSAMLFSAVHASLAQTLPLFIFGIVQCLAYEKARSLWLPVTLHMLFNGFNVVAILYFM